jgi:eukaryotic-like serine/threonine-protein kinase
MQLSLQPGTRVAGHRLLRPLGAGAQSLVFLAERGSQREPVALKIVPLPVGEEAAAVAEAFLAAAARARQLQHPHIVVVHGAGIEGPLAWLAMEAVPGSDLERYTQPTRLLPEALAVDLCARLAQALAHAHRLGIVHRDLKPANVLLDLATRTLKLADFGLARAVGGSETGTGLMLGTPAYMAPEQLAGAVPSAATDLYALGVLLFELLAGRRPHEGATMGELLRQVAQEPAPPLLALKPRLLPELAALVARLLDKVARNRPSDALVVAAELEQLHTRLRHDAGN